MSDDAPTTVIGLNPFEPGFYDDPYAQYAAIREADPISKTALGPWLITRWDDVHTLLRKPGTSVEDRNIEMGGPSRRELMNELRAEHGAEQIERSLAILNIDPPDHTRIRKLVAKAFTPRAVERIRASAGEQVDAILDDLAERDEPVDLISELAFPLPFAVINEMLGMPEGGDTLQLRAWSHTITQILDPLLAMQHPNEIIQASINMRGVIAEAIAWKRTRDDDDILAAMIHAEEDGESLNDAELLENVMLLFLAGHETTVNLIGNGTNALLDHPDQLRRLVDDPSLAANAVEELLRFDSPVQFSRRIALEPIEVAGVAIEPGELVMTCLGAANRDPRKFGADAAELRLDRPDAREHVSFGSGVHHCLGAALARLEGQEAIGRLVRRFPDLERAGDPTHNQRIVLRGYDDLPVSLA
ncbi:cytochrome P450 [Aquihabitans daechungensis]|uniref:cytochrome P450 n=1 Tax=Aquihabitans daechungensis TaxID=1052257 RepID=UPI003BA3898F